MINRVNYFTNLINLFLIFIYLIFINISAAEKQFEYLLVLLITINLLIKLLIWINFDIIKKKNLHFFIDNIFFNDRFTKLSVLILSNVTPIYMIFQKDSLVTDLIMEKLSFLLVFLFSLIGFYLEFFILESKSNK
tara:strand:+ start:363 stop:767 length:405 start_codon:yes stop_codon:yes gene_type:complete